MVSWDGRDRKCDSPLEKDEAVYGLTDCDAEMKYYGKEVSRVIGVLRAALKELQNLREDYRLKD